VYTIEFQKRLPRCHLCIWLKSDDKLRTPADIDRCISAEIPDKDVDPELHQLVKECMMHGPCGPDHRSCPCMVENKCSKKFPKSFNEETFIDENGYAIYKRSDNGRTVKNKAHTFMMDMYQAHINVEYCNQFGSIKYLFKYINKGPDRVTVAVEDEEKDEINDYYDCRYLSSCEAAWRIFKFDIHHRFPAVERLPFHLPDQQSVEFDPSESIDFQLDKVSTNTSKFLAWMDCNEKDVHAQKHLYVEFPKYYVWNQTDRIWTPRKQGKSIGRIHHVPPSWGELFYLRRLLNHVRGARKWEDFKEFEGIVYPTCKEACYARGLLEDNKEFIKGIIEASEWGMRDYLRNYFVMLILSDTMSRPEIVWEKTWKLLAEDVLLLEKQKRNHPDLQLSDTQRYNICLTYIEEKLLNNSKSLKNIVNMPYPNDEFTMEGYNRLIYDELDYKIPELIIQHQELYESLTDEQRGIHGKIVDACDNNKGGMFFVYGYGGTGKTFLYKTLTAAIRSKDGIILNVASSGIASLLLDGGRTTHSRFAIPINIVEDSMCSISADGDLAELIREAKLIIWDEAPMINRLAYEEFDRTLRDICTGTYTTISDKVFGGKVVVFGGDFRQILPIIPHEGKIEGKNNGHAPVEFPEEMLILDSDDHIESLITETYDNWQHKLWDPTYFQDRAILAPTNEQVDKVNERMLAKLPGREKVCYSSDSVSDVDIDFNFNESLYTTEFLNTIKMSGIPHHKLVLKNGAPVMCLRNIDQRGGLCNGTRL
ncbi:uncharacterized protein Tco_0200166, partial [Tanacetum coccineum]